MIDYIDNEEKEIIESLHSVKWNTEPDHEQNKVYEEYAKYSIENGEKIEIYLKQQDFQKIQEKALEEGVTYQAMISMLIHKFNEGEVELVR